MAVPVESRPYRFRALAPGDHAGCSDLIFGEIDVRHGGRYAGMRSDDYLSGLRYRGGAILERDQEVRAFFPAAVRRGRGLLLPFPVIAADDENLGLQCLGHLVQLSNAIMETRTLGPLLEPYIIFPDDNLPSPKLVHILGLCDAMPDRRQFADVKIGRNHRFDIRPEMLPSVISALLNRDPAWVGAACITTTGKCGSARVQFPPKTSPFTLNRMPVFAAIAARQLSVIGLKDTPTSRFSI